MPSRPHLEVLFDVRDNALFAIEWTAGHTREIFRQDMKTFYAVTRCLEIVSEASRRLPQELRDRHPQLPWRAIMDAGNYYRHRYDNVAEDLVWDTVREDLEPLVAAVEAEIANQPMPAEGVSKDETSEREMPDERIGSPATDDKHLGEAPSRDQDPEMEP